MIVFEGPARAGKTHQATLQHDSLKHYERVETIQFPDRSKLSGIALQEIIDKRKLVSTRMAYLMFSEHRRLMTSEIENKIKEGITVIIDGFDYPGIFIMECN